MSRLAVVCGGSRGIGKAVSRLLARRGCRLALVSRDEDAARTAAASLHGGKCTKDIFLLNKPLVGKTRLRDLICGCADRVEKSKPRVCDCTTRNLIFALKA